MLYRHQGDFMNLLPSKPNLIKEIPQYTTFRKSISETFKEGTISLGLSRIIAKVNTTFIKENK